MKLYLFVFHVINILVCNEVFAENETAGGPYKAIMQNMTRCEKPPLPYQKDPSVLFFAEVYNTTRKSNLIRGNITIVKENADYRIKTKCYTQEDGQWTINRVINSGGCRGVLLSIYATSLGLKYDKGKCLLEKGTYSFSNIDSNKLEHAWGSTKTYGLTKCRIEVIFGHQTAECWEFYELIVPL